MKHTTDELSKLIEKHLSRAKEFKGNPAGEESRQIAQFLVELMAYRQYHADWKIKEGDNNEIQESK